MFVSKYNSEIDYDYVTTNREGAYFDRKSFETKPSEIANDIIGMANGSGGVIAIGIKDRNIQKCEISNTRYNNLLQVLYDFISPIPKVQIEEIPIENDKKIILYHVDSNVEQIYKRSDNGEIYLRVGDETRKLNPEQAQNLSYDKGMRAFEDAICNDFDDNDFRYTLIDFYKERLKYSGDYKDLLLNRGLAKKEDNKIYYKNSAILLFAQDPNKYISSSYIRYVRYDGDKQNVGENFNVIKDEKLYGPIPVLIEIISKFLGNVFEEYFYLDIEEGKFKSTLEFPKEARLEGIVNALTHRSYNRQGNPITVFHYNNRLEIHNAGPLPSNVTVNNIKYTRYSRNPRIARVLNELGYVRELNEGVKRIFSSMEATLLGKPIYKDENQMVSLILENNVKNHIKTLGKGTFNKIADIFISLAPIEKDIVLFMLRNGKTKMSEMVKDSGKTNVTLRGYFKSLENKGIILKNAKNEKDPGTYYTFK